MATSDDFGRECEMEEEELEATQRVLVMRHGDRLDCENWTWAKTASRPYDTPLSGKGIQEAASVAKRRCKRRMNVKLVISSPFLRCLQTAQEVVRVLDQSELTTCNTLCELLVPGSNILSTPEVPGDDIEKHGVVVHLNLDTRPMPEYPETRQKAEERYQKAINELADEHWPEDIVLVTHQYGVEQALVVGGKRDDHLYEVTYCGNVELIRDGTVRGGQWSIDSTDRIYKYDVLF